MLMNSTVTVFAKPKERANKAGETYTRLEAYGDLAELKGVIDAAVAAGHTVVKVLPRVYVDKKTGQNCIAVEISSFKGDPDYKKKS